MLEKWKTIKTEKRENLRIFDLEIATRENLKDGNIGDFTVLRSNNWVNVIPITKNEDVIFIEQYRQGTDSIELEIPGGLIEKGETPGEAARRECTEETGFTSEKPIEYLGETFPNPAFLTNRCYTFIWRDVELTHELNLDSHEDIEIVKYKLEEVPRLILSGAIRHGVILAALNFQILRKR